MFSSKEERAIQEKFGQLKSVIDGELSTQELVDIITKRRIGWWNDHKVEMGKKYGQLPPDERAYKIVFLEHMGINPEHSKMLRVSENKIKIESFNFCPYLVACQELGLDTGYVCKVIGEKPIQDMMILIHPNLRFSRNYENIRPENPNYCEEFIELI